MRLPQLPALPDAETRASTDGEAALATRERALHAVFRNDLALRRLLWRAALARWRADPATAIPPPASAATPLTLLWMSLLRLAWRVVGAAALFLAAILLT
jgi:hypothetical protein